MATFIICLFVGVNHTDSFVYATLDISIHFIMDRIKASPNMLGCFNPKDKGYWYVLGVDQMVHHMTHYLIIVSIISSLTTQGILK